jgi:uncharacterized protein (UPF0262 family)
MINAMLDGKCLADTEPQGMNSDTNKLVGVNLDETLSKTFSADVDHERKVAIYDLIESNNFEVVGKDLGPYSLTLSIDGTKLVFNVSDNDGAVCSVVVLALSPLRRIVKDYYGICESYYQAIRSATPSQIETIDMARRGLHNEGSQVLMQRLDGKITVDFDTARRLFTLVCVLHWRG